MSEIIVDNKCPICEGEILDGKKGMGSLICKNGCIETERFQVFTNYNIFGSKTTVYDFKTTFYQLGIDKINKEIEYWKKDFRYLAEMLTRD